MIRKSVKRFSEKIMPNLKSSDGSAPGGASCDDALLFGRWCAREMRPPSDSGNPNEKTRGRFPARAFAVLAMMTICR